MTPDQQLRDRPRQPLLGIRAQKNRLERKTVGQKRKVHVQKCEEEALQHGILRKKQVFVLALESDPLLLFATEADTSRNGLGTC